jgi:hypothetical protein
MSQLNPNKWLVLWSVVSTVLNLCFSFVLVYCTYSTNRTTTKQVEIIDELREIIRDDEAVSNRSDFDHALEDASEFIPSCSSCSPTYLMAVPLDRAVSFEPKTDGRLSAAEYNNLAALGSAFWSVTQTETYANKALEKSATPLDKYISYLILGHTHFKHHKDDPEHANLNKAREYFKKAFASLEMESGNEVGKYNLGDGHGILAIHEAFFGYDKEAGETKKLAASYWSSLSSGESLVKELEGRISAAKSGTKPEIFCLFKRPVTQLHYTITSQTPTLAPTETKPSFFVPLSPEPAKEPDLSPHPGATSPPSPTPPIGSQGKG